jgi:hypothetical protein
MKTENIVLLIIAGVILYEFSKKPEGGGVHWINCDDPKADPVMCGLLGQEG